MRVLRDRALGLTRRRPEAKLGSVGSDREPGHAGPRPRRLADRLGAWPAWSSWAPPRPPSPPLETLVAGRPRRGPGGDAGPDRRRGRGGGPVAEPGQACGPRAGPRRSPTGSTTWSAPAPSSAWWWPTAGSSRRRSSSVLPMVNLHFSLLPRWRGAAPVERAILDGDAETGVCLMAVEAGLDTGPDLRRGRHADRRRRDGGRAAGPPGRPSAARLLGRAPGRRRGRAARSARRRPATPTYADKIRPEELELRLGAARAAELGRVVRLGRAWTTFRGRRLRVLRVRPRLAGRPSRRTPPGTRRAAPRCGAGRARLALVDRSSPRARRPMEVGRLGPGRPARPPRSASAP